MRVAWLLAVAVVFAAGCGKEKSAAPAGPVGTVALVVGDVQATRAGQTARKLEVGAEVFGDDVIKTGVGARVELALVGGARYEIGAEAERKLGQQLALLKGAAGGGAAGDVTAAAGRHGEQEAAGTEATAETGGGGAKGGSEGSGAQGGGGPGSGAPEATAALPPPGAAPVMAPPKIEPPPPEAEPAPPARPAPRPAQAQAPDLTMSDQEVAQAETEAKQRELDDLMLAEERLAVLRRGKTEAKASRELKPEAPNDKSLPAPCAPDNPLCSNSGPKAPSKATIPPPPAQLTAEQVKGVVLPALPELRRCGAASFKADKTLTALTVKINMEIGPTGKVATVGVAEASAAPKYDACVLAKAKKLKFPRAAQSTKLRLPVAAHP